jgi:hypothetical protein
VALIDGAYTQQHSDDQMWVDVAIVEDKPEFRRSQSSIQAVDEFISNRRDKVTLVQDQVQYKKSIN